MSSGGVLTHGARSFDICLLTWLITWRLLILSCMLVRRGGETVAYLHGFGNGTVVRKLQSGWTLLKLGGLSSPLNEVIDKVTLYIVACYDKPPAKSMSDAWIAFWLHRTGRAKTKPVDLIINLLLWHLLLKKDTYDPGKSDCNIASVKEYTGPWPPICLHFFTPP